MLVSCAEDKPNDEAGARLITPESIQLEIKSYLGNKMLKLNPRNRSSTILPR